MQQKWLEGLVDKLYIEYAADEAERGFAEIERELKTEKNF